MGTTNPNPRREMAEALGVLTSAQQAMVSQGRETTQLETHIGAFAAMRDSLVNANERAQRMADRLMGCEPQPVPPGAGRSLANSAAEPPLLAQLEILAASSSEVLDSLHRNLNRLERV